MTVRALKKKNNMPNFKKNTSSAMKRSGFKMKGYTYPGVSPMKDVKSNNLLESVEVSGGKKTTFDDKNRRMTKSELRDAKINPKPGTTYYKNKKTGAMSTTN